MKQLLLINLFLILNLLATAQTTDDSGVPNGGSSSTDFSKVYTSIIPPSPEAASLGKYVDTPVDLSTGQQTISIPLHTVQGKEVSVPISLSYIAGGGIKVEEMSSWVGLGWALNAGGNISRVVYGSPDEVEEFSINNYYDADFNDLYEKHANTLQKLSAGESLNHCDETIFQSIQEFMIEDQKLYQTNYNDSEPDLYFYNFNGLGGKMFIDVDKKAHCMPYQAYKVLPPINGNEWHIRTDDGTQYFFGEHQDGLYYATENTFLPANDEGQIDKTYRSAWYLTTIISANGKDTIRFNYTITDPIVQNSNFALRQHIKNATSDNLQCIYGNDVGVVKEYYDFNKPQQNICYLHSITSNHGETVRFYSYQDRKDYIGAYRLYQIVVSNRNGEIIKQISLDNNHYFGSSTSTNEEQLRLKLNSVIVDGSVDFSELTQEEIGNILTDNYTIKVNPQAQTYRFDYNSSQLPSRLSSAQDLGGYFNGDYAGFIPSYTLKDGTVLSGAARKPNPDYAQACILRKITYPTRGYKLFNYEGNKITRLPEFRKERAKFRTSLGAFSKTSPPENAWIYYPDGYQPTGEGSNSMFNPVWEVKTFHVYPNDEGKKITLNFSSEGHIDEFLMRRAILVHVSDEYLDHNYSGNLANSLGLLSPNYTLDDTFLGGEFVYMFTPNGEETYKELNQPYESTPTVDAILGGRTGTFQILLLQNGYFAPQLSFNYETYRAKFYPSQEEYLPGIRLKSIESFDYTNQKLLQKDFIYEEPKRVKVVNPWPRPTYTDSSLDRELTFEEKGEHYFDLMMSTTIEVGKPSYVYTTTEYIPLSDGDGATSDGCMHPHIPGNNVLHCEYVHRFASSQAILGGTGYHIGYSSVIEKNTNWEDDTHNGFIKSQFYFEEIPSTDYVALAPDYSKIQNNGTLIGRQVYNQDSLLIQEESFFYPFNSQNNAGYSVGSVIGYKLVQSKFQRFRDAWLGWLKTDGNIYGCDKEITVFRYACDAQTLNQNHLWNNEGELLIGSLDGLYTSAAPIDLNREVKKYSYKSVWNNYLISQESKYYPKPSVLLFSFKPVEDKNYVENVTSYHYAWSEFPNNNYPYLREIKTTNLSKGEEQGERYQYSFDLVNPQNPPNNPTEHEEALLKMLDRNQLSKVIGSQKWIKQPKDLQPKITYKLQENYRYQDELNQTLLDNVQVAPTGGLLETRLSNFRYDTLGNPIYYEQDGISTSILYDMKGLLPIAQVVNARPEEIFLEDFEDVEAVDYIAAFSGVQCHLEDYTLNLPVNFIPDENSIISYWYRLENKWRFHEESYTPSITNLSLGSAIDQVRIYPRDAQMQSFTYEHLLGMTSQTDAHNQVIHYQYDNQNRLETVSDEKGDILQYYDYHYRVELYQANFYFSNEYHFDCAIQNQSFLIEIGSDLVSSDEVNYIWNFGDGTQLTNNSPQVNHIYSNSGVYPIKVTISGAGFEERIIQDEITVYPDLNISNINCEEGCFFDFCENEIEAILNGSSVSKSVYVQVQGGTRPYSYRWEWKKENQDWNLLLGSTSILLPFAYENYEIRCTVTDNCGRSSSISKLIQVSDASGDCTDAQGNPIKK